MDLSKWYLKKERNKEKEQEIYICLAEEIYICVADLL